MPILLCELEGLTQEFTGASQTLGFDKVSGVRVTGVAEPITKLEDVGEFIASKQILIRNAQGRAVAGVKPRDRHQQDGGE